MKLEVESISIKKRFIEFKYKDTAYKIPSNDFPLSKKDFSIFNIQNTIPFDNQAIMDEIDTLILEENRCYSNTQLIKNILDKHNIKNKFFSGWFFIGGQLPIHHSWNVIYTDKGVSVIDSAKLQLSIKVMQLEIANKEEYQEQYNKLLNTLPNREMIIYSLYPHLFYIGAEDTKENSRHTAYLLTSKNHFSY